MIANRDAAECIMTALDRRIADLQGRASTLLARHMAEEVDAIRRIAHDHGLGGLCDMAHGLHLAMARNDGAVALGPWLDAMRGLLGHDPADPIAAQSWMAVLAQRYCR